MKKFIARGMDSRTFNYNGQFNNEEEALISFEAKEISDGYHTFDELYDHRRALNAALFNVIYQVDRQTKGAEEARLYPIVIKSKLHNDGTMFDGGYFIVVLNWFGTQISYHYELKYWNEFKIPEVEKVPWIYDEHTPNDCIERLLKL